MSITILLLGALACTPGTPATAVDAPSLPDTLMAASPDTSATRGWPGDSVRFLGLEYHLAGRVEGDTVRPRPRAIEVSDAYEMRLRIHRYASYTMIPLFVLQSVAGNQLYQADRTGAVRPGWAETTHSAGAAGLGALFTLNTVTGAWNLWDSRHNDVGRTKRWIHSALLLGSDAGFTWSGIKLASDARNSQSGRDQHRRVSFISMGAALAGYAVMLIGDH